MFWFFHFWSGKSNLPFCDYICPALPYRCKELRAVNLSWCGKLTDAAIQYLSACKKLRSLNLSMCVRLTDASAVLLMQCSQLQSINLYGCQNLTDKAACALSSIRSLRVVVLSQCRYARDLFPSFSCAFLFVYFILPHKSRLLCFGRVFCRRSFVCFVQLADFFLFVFGLFSANHGLSSFAFVPIEN